MGVLGRDAKFGVLIEHFNINVPPRFFLELLIFGLRTLGAPVGTSCGKLSTSRPRAYTHSRALRGAVQKPGSNSRPSWRFPSARISGRKPTGDAHIEAEWTRSWETGIITSYKARRKEGKEKWETLSSC